MFSILYSKVVSGCVLLVVTVASGFVPYLSGRRFMAKGTHHGHKTASRINSTQAFASGVFIATCLVHLLPEAMEAVKKSVTSELPVCEMIVSFGFLLLLVTENIIIGCHETGRDRNSTLIVSSDSRPVNSGDVHNENGKDGLNTASSETRSTYGSVGWSGNQQHQHAVSFSSLKESTEVLHTDTHDDGRSDVNEKCPILRDERRKGSLGEQGMPDKHQTDAQKKKEKEVAKKKKAVLKSFVLLFALSVHTVFDGLVVGLQDKQSEVWTLLAAVCLHKALVSISIALSLLESHYDHPRASLLYLFLFSLVAPIGLIVGVVLTETQFNTHAQLLTTGVLQSVATGTFMYVTFVESLKGRFDDGNRLLNVLWVLVGFGLVCALRIVLPS